MSVVAAAALELPEEPGRTLEGASARALGAYYTPPTAALVMADWVMRDGRQRVLEPSMGDGVFVRAVKSAAAARGTSAEIWGVELAADTFAAAVSSGLIPAERAIREDFLAVRPFAVDAVIGNPPYVRLRHVPPAEAAVAASAAAAVLGAPMEPAGSIWMPFLLHATRFLTPGGRVAFVLPYDFTYVRYARPLWELLGRSFGELRIARVHERVFPEIMQDTVLFFADGYGGRTDSVTFEAYERVDDLVAERPAIVTSIPLTRVVAGERPFVESLLAPELVDLLDGRVSDSSVRARDLVRFNIGYVSGDKRFFHPGDEVVRAFNLPAHHLVPSLTSSRQMRRAGVLTSGVEAEAVSRLYLPASESLTPAERRYIRLGERTGVSNRFKCRVRDPWYVTPGVKVPDVVVPVFADTPLLLANDSRAVASNSLLCGYLRPEVSAESLLARWYTSLTLLQVEIEVHSLGGGVRVFVPNEAGAVRLPARADVTPGSIAQLHALVRRGELDQAYANGDRPVLRRQMGLSVAEVELIREGVAVLAHWRNSVRTSRV